MTKTQAKREFIAALNFHKRVTDAARRAEDRLAKATRQYARVLTRRAK